jgi:hypothetical protein
LTYAQNNRSGAFVSECTNLENGHISEKVKIETLDDFFQDKWEKPDFIKIDVEGFEGNVINGGKNFINKIKPTVVMEMNVFCLNVLHRISLPDFIDKMKLVFPILYAIDNDNRKFLNLHKPDDAYLAMHEHIVNGRYQNLVGGFKDEINQRLINLITKANEHLDLIRVGENDIPARLAGWYDNEPTHRWSEGNRSSISFELETGDENCTRLSLSGFSNGEQRIALKLNGKPIHSSRLSGAMESLEMALPTGTLKSGKNILEFELPDARHPGNGDPRILGFALKSLKIGS